MKEFLVCFLIISISLGGLIGCGKDSSENTGSQGGPQGNYGVEDLLKFHKDEYTEETMVVQTSEGEKNIIYKYYEDICYVTKPVDGDYQSLNIKVPVRINDKKVNATNAPILFANSVGGYLSVSNTKDEGEENNFTENIMEAEEAESDGEIMIPKAAKGELTKNNEFALAAGYVVVEPGCRGRDNINEEGVYYGKAPAAIVDLKAAIRYLRHNKGLIPGNTDWIISTGTSAGGAISALLGASGNSSLYDEYLKEIGAADEDDNIFASGCYSPITDLNHADMCYEWMFGDVPQDDGELVNQNISKELQDLFSEYQISLNLIGDNDFGVIMADNYQEYLLINYLYPSAAKYLANLSEAERTDYLSKNSWLTWEDDSASFMFEDYLKHIGRSKDVPAFDDFALTSPETLLFGDRTINARHFTDFSAEHNTATLGNTEIDEKLENAINLMNPMFFIGQNNENCTDHWWIRYGSSDNNTSLPVIINLTLALKDNDKLVNTSLYWDGGHGVNEDPEDFIKWIGEITGYKNK